MNEKLRANAIRRDDPKSRNAFASKDVLASNPKPIAIKTDDILEWPNGDIETKNIAAILSEAHEKSLPDSAIVQYCKSQRAKDWDPNHPEYETMTRKTTVGQLKGWFRDIESYDFDAEQYSNSRINNQFAVYIYHNPRTGFTDLVTLAQD
jgi:hypothetical protein